MNQGGSVREGSAGAGGKQPRIIPVIHEHDVPGARQAAITLARRVGFRQTPTYEVAVSVTELANNLCFHATGGGTITLCVVERDGRAGLEVTAEDDGPGIADVRRAMADGFTTNKGLGSGLPGVERLMDEFEISSALGGGTRIVARKWRRCR